MIPVNEPLLNGNEAAYLMECVRSGWVGSDGPFVKEFENKLAAKVNRTYGIAVCNGSAALEVVIQALNIGKGDEVILPSFTIISCAAAIVKAGATPVLVDADPVTWNMNVSQIEQKITARTKAIMVVHIYGLCVNMDPVIEIAKRHQLKVIEDAAEAHGNLYKGQPAGSFGDVSVFSFYPNKLITTGEGGMVLTNDQVLAERCRSIRNLCFEPEKRFVHHEIGSNFRMSNLQAAVGLAQFERWDEFVVKKKHIGDLYNQLLKNTDSLTLPLVETEYCSNGYWVYGLLLKENVKMSAAEFCEELRQKGIGTRPFFYPMHLQPVLKQMGLFKDEKYPVSEKLYNRGFYIPSGLGITDEQQMTVAQTIQQILS